MAKLALSLLGALQITIDGQPVTNLKSDKVRALLAYLAVNADRPHRRSVLAALLWPDIPDRAARSNLRDALSNLRSGIRDRAATPPFLLVTRDTVQFDLASDHRLDVEEFRRLLDAGQQETLSPEPLGRAIALYQGAFLEGFSLKDSPAFDDWSLLTREQLQRQALLALRRLARFHEASGEYGQACDYAWRQVELEPWDEDAHQQLMLLLALSGQRGTALAQYENCKRLLAQELGVDPSQETTTLYEQIRDGDLQTLPAFRASVGLQPRQVGDCPYRGLASFRQADAPFFHGREAFSGRLLEAVGQQRASVVIVGSSGSGKSSVVFAGLAPRLSENEAWRVAACRPGALPFQALAAALMPLLEPELGEPSYLIESRKLADALRQGEIALLNVVQRALEKSRDANRLLLIVDQFEETYTLCSELAIRQMFLDELLVAVEAGARQRSPAFCLLLTLRADFMGRALAYRPFADLLQDATLMMGPMNDDELRSAIEEPALMQGAAFEAGLVERLLDDVGDEPGSLPLLEFALTLLWEEQGDGWLTHEAYAQIGGVEGALASYADDVLNELATEEQERAQRVFVQLVRPGLGTEDTRRLATRAELGDENWSLVQQLADKRLVVTGQEATGQESVEVVHEALIQCWSQLQAWMDADRTFRTWQEGLRAAWRGWQASDQDEGALLRGAPLAQAESWLAQRGGELGVAERGYIQAGLALRTRQGEERERRRRRTILGLAGGLVFAVLLGLVALGAWRSAQREAAVNHSLVLAGSAQRLQDSGEVDLALALALEAAAIDEPPPEALRTLSTLAQSPGTRSIIPAHDRAVSAVAFVPKTPEEEGGGWLALSASCSQIDGEGTCSRGELALWDLDTRTELSRSTIDSGRINTLALVSGGQTALLGSSDAQLILWEIEPGREIRRFEGHTGAINQVAISPDGLTAFSASDDGSLVQWDLASGQEIRRLEGHIDCVTSVDISPEGQTVLSGSDDANLILWDLATGQEIRRLKGHKAGGISALFRPGGEQALSTADDYAIRVWDVETGTLVRSDDFVMGTTVAAIHPNGRTVLFRDSPMLQVWDIDALRLSDSLRGHAGEISAVDISPDGRLALSGADDGELRLWNLEGQAEVRRFEASGAPIFAVDASPDGRHLLSGGAEIIVWDVETGQALRSLEGFLGFVGPGAITFGPQGQLALAASEDLFELSDRSSMMLWDAGSGEVLHEFEGHGTYARSGDISPDGELALTGSQNLEEPNFGDLLLWDLETGEIIRRFDTTDDIASIAFNSDGSRALTGSAYFPSPILWDVGSGSPILRLAGHPNHLVLVVAFGADEDTAISASAEGGIILWDLATGDMLQRYEGHEAGVLSLDVSPDGRHLISGDTNGTVILWDLNSGEEVRRFRGHSTAVFDVAFAPDGQTAFSVSPDGQIIQWQTGERPLDEQTAWIEANRYVPALSCGQRARYRVEPACEEPSTLPSH